MPPAHDGFFARLRGAIRLVAVVLVVSAGFTVYGLMKTKNQPKDAPIRAAAESFVRAFNNLDWDRFRAAFADDATVFLPFPEAPGRRDGWAAAEPDFRAFFETMRRERSGPPYLHIDPQRLHVQRLGADAALVSFEFDAASGRNRRTLALELRGERWLIVHMHGSSVAASASSKPAQ